MIERTQTKLREAQFFLAKLVTESANSGCNPNEVIAFYASAFLSAGRSVTFVLESEAGEKYKNWSVAWRASLPTESQLLLARLKDARNRALKRETPVFAEDMTKSGVLQARTGVPLGAALLLDEDTEFFLTVPRVLSVDWISGESRDLVQLCRDYLALLEILVRDFCADFPGHPIKGEA